MNTRRVLVYTGGYRPDHPTRDIPLVEELRRRGNYATYGVGGPGVSGIPHPKHLIKDIRFTDIRTHWINSALGMFKLLGSTDVLVVDIWDKMNMRYVRLAKSMGVVTLQHNNVSEITIPYLGADWVCDTSSFFAEERIRRAHAEGIPWSNIQESKIVVTGSTMIDDVQSPQVAMITKATFCEKYGLDPSKKIAVWMPSAPQVQDDWHQTNYTQICETIQKSAGHSLIIKPHPNDYLKRKTRNRPNLQGKHTWETLAPTAVVLEPEDAWLCYKVCDVGISNSSSVSMEFPLFSKPFIYVDIDKSPVLALHRSNRWWGDLPVPSFIGMITSVDELGSVLDESRYEVSDRAAYQSHVAKYFYQNDGLAYQRVADVVEQALNESQNSNPLVRWARGGMWAARELLSSRLHRVSDGVHRNIARLRR